MNVETLTFDIETIPIQKKLTPIQQEESEKRIEAVLKRKFPNQEKYTDEEYEDAKGLALSTTPYLGEIVCIGVHRTHADGSEQTYSFTGSESNILLDFWGLLSNFKGLFVSFNGLDFDTPFIIKRSMYHSIRPTNNSFLDLKRFSRWPHFDVKAVIGDYDKYASGTLALICDFLGVPSPKEGDIKANGVAKAYLDGQINLIAEYCVRDVIATYKCYQIISKYVYTPTKY